jgi:hypothetical protein
MAKAGRLMPTTMTKNALTLMILALERELHFDHPVIMRLPHRRKNQHSKAMADTRAPHRSRTLNPRATVPILCQNLSQIGSVEARKCPRKSLNQHQSYRQLQVQETLRASFTATRKQAKQRRVMELAKVSIEILWDLLSFIRRIYSLTSVLYNVGGIPSTAGKARNKKDKTEAQQDDYGK